MHAMHRRLRRQSLLCHTHIRSTVWCGVAWYGMVRHRSQACMQGAVAPLRLCLIAYPGSWLFECLLNALNRLAGTPYATGYGALAAQAKANPVRFTTPHALPVTTNITTIPEPCIVYQPVDGLQARTEAARVLAQQGTQGQGTQFIS